MFREFQFWRDFVILVESPRKLRCYGKTKTVEYNSLSMINAKMVSKLEIHIIWYQIFQDAGSNLKFSNGKIRLLKVHPAYYHFPNTTVGNNYLSHGKQIQLKYAIYSDKRSTSLQRQ